jgi:DNA helicase-2/ATP-dependent DNA helicase PcrA
VVQLPEALQFLNPEIAVSLRKFVSLLQLFREQSRYLNLAELIRTMMQELAKAGFVAACSDFEWLSLVDPWAKDEAYGNLLPFIEGLALLKEGENYNPNSEKVTLMTVHAAKGLEFPVIFMIGLESGIFPCTEFGIEPAGLEEERRLFYVGMTRAKERLYLCHAQERYLFGENRRRAPSPFISEVPRELIHNTSRVAGNSQLKKKPKVKQLNLFS